MITRLFCLLLTTCLLAGGVAAQESGNQLYILHFKGLRTKLTKQTMVTLDSFAVVLQNKPAMNVEIITYCVAEKEKFNMASWHRVDHIVQYFMEKHHMDAHRFIYRHGSDRADCNEVTLSLTTDKIDPIIDHPSLRRRKQ